MRIGYHISGAVQGVGFRYFTRRAGERIGIIGWVRNLEDGRVEAVADGTATQLEEFARALGQGPPGAHVTDVHAMEVLDDTPLPMRFEIR